MSKLLKVRVRFSQLRRIKQEVAFFHVLNRFVVNNYCEHLCKSSDFSVCTPPPQQQKSIFYLIFRWIIVFININVKICMLYMTASHSNVYNNHNFMFRSSSPNKQHELIESNECIYTICNVFLDIEADINLDGRLCLG